MKERWRVVIVEPVDRSGESYRMLREAGCEVILGRDGWDYPGDAYTEEEMIELCKGADGIIARSRDHYSRRLIESIPNLRVISKHGAGTDSIDVKAATEKGVIVAHTPLHAPLVAEHTVALILAIMKRLKEADHMVQSGAWKGPTFESTSVSGKVIGIFGFGRIGMEVAKRLQGWEAQILAYDPFVKRELFQEYGAQSCATLNEMLDRVDILSINANLTEETRHIVGEEALQRLKKTAYVVNTARGGIIDEKALINALKEGRIAGAALDVFEKEPPDPSSELLKMENVILTPHMSGRVPGMFWLLTRSATESALMALQGDVPKYVKNPEVIDAWLRRFGKGEDEKTLLE
jgi:D-3-phosphoglycerate dehydrogenase